jgi:hypothetical protein
MTRKGEDIKNSRFWEDIVYGRPLSYIFLFQKGIVKIYFESSILSVGVVSISRSNFSQKRLQIFSLWPHFLTSFSKQFLILLSTGKLFFHYENVCSLQIWKITPSAFLIQNSVKVRINKIIGRIQDNSTKIIQNYKKSNWTKLTN